jgi:hypothetical protein
VAADGFKMLCRGDPLLACLIRLGTANGCTLCGSQQAAAHLGWLRAEVQDQLAVLDSIMDDKAMPGPTTMSAVSMARMDYEERLEAAINEQIK